MTGAATAVTDFELLEAWRSGDLNSGQMLLLRHAGSLHRFLRSKLEEGLEDVLQETWLACVEGRAAFRREAKFRTYLLQVARFQLYRYYRRRSRQPEFNFRLTSVMDIGRSPAQWLERRQDERLLLRALRRVPRDYQIVVQLRFWQDLTGGEMAQVLGVPEPTVRTRLRRATEALKAELARPSREESLVIETPEDLERWSQTLHAALVRDADPQPA